MQMLNRRFYQVFVPQLVREISLYEIGTVGSGLMVFPGQEQHINILNQSLPFGWKQHPISFFRTNDQSVMELAKLYNAEDALADEHDKIIVEMDQQNFALFEGRLTEAQFMGIIQRAHARIDMLNTQYEELETRFAEARKT